MTHRQMEDLNSADELASYWQRQTKKNPSNIYSPEKSMCAVTISYCLNYLQILRRQLGSISPYHNS